MDPKSTGYGSFTGTDTDTDTIQKSASENTHAVLYSSHLKLVSLSGSISVRVNDPLHL